MEVDQASTDIYSHLKKAFNLDIDISKLWLEKDINREGSISRNEFKNILKQLPIGLLEKDINKVMSENI